MKSLEELRRIQEKALKRVNIEKDREGTRIVVGVATCGIAAGAKPVLAALLEEVKTRDLKDVVVDQTGCIGVCRLEPIVEVYRPGEKKVTYVEVTAEKAKKIILEHIINGKVVNEYTIGANQEAVENQVQSINDVGFFKKQTRVALINCGIIDPENINDYIAFDGYKALGKVLTEMSQEQAIDTVKKSGLRGRGGGGFPTGLKWEFTNKSQDDQKYVACNADEGDPGAFMDRSVLEGDPNSVVEAMAIAGYAIGSDQGYIYVRAEYPIAVHRLEIAIKQARELGLLGKNIFGTDFNFDLEIRLGAGAFVCGEETALLNSIEGKRGMPRPRPPFPAIKGLWQKPTLLNNVETYANIPQIILNGAEWFSAMGTEKSKGTKVFALGGKINNTGLIEIPMGTTLREVIYEIGGGIPDGKEFKAVLTGGPSGGCITKAHLDTPIDYDNLVALGSMMGSGGMIVMDEDNCMVDIARFFLDFMVEESCGKCTPCREGTKRMLEILERITEGKGDLQDIDKLESLAKTIKTASLCGLGQTSPNPVLSTLNYFRDEYIAHVVDKKCAAGVCKHLITYTVISDICKECGICAKQCPVNCMDGIRGKEIFKINQDECIKCGACMQACPFNAIIRN